MPISAIAHPTPFPPLEPIKILKQIKETYFSRRVSKDWKVALMDSGTTLAVASFIFSFFTQSALVSISFFCLTAITGTGSFYMRQFADLKGLEESIASLKRSERRFQQIATELEDENKKLKKTSRTLKRTSADLRKTNVALNQQVTKLSLEVTNLAACIKEIKEELAQFRMANRAYLNNNNLFRQGLKRLNQKLDNTERLHEVVSERISSQQNTLDTQLNDLKIYLEELRSKQGLRNKMRELKELREQTERELSRLEQVRTAFQALQRNFASERGKFEALREALEEVRRALSTEVGAFRTSNQQLKGTGEKLHRAVERLWRLYPMQ